MIEEIKYNNEIISIIIRNNFKKDGSLFLTPNDSTQQLAYMYHSAGKTIKAHIHIANHREINLTQEVLFIRRGKIRVDLYNKQRVYLESKVLESGDVILLAYGGHGFEMIEDTEMIEVKQGPFIEGIDKEFFTGVDIKQIEIK